MCLLVLFSCDHDHGLDSDDSNFPSNQSNLVRTCGMHNHMEKLLTNPDYAKMHQNKLAKIESMASTRSLCSNPVVLPVAVHFQGVNGDPACLVSLAENQIQILNDDFNGTNSDISNWTNGSSSSFPGVNFAEACLSFQLADTNHPSGFGLVDGQPAVTINQTTGDFNASFSGYLNIFVQFGTGVLGYSPLGGSGNGDGVVVEASAFGSGSGCGNVVPNAPYNLGRTTTHEVGHYLLLDHIWGGGCGQDDGVSDTPSSADSYYDCPSVGVSSCGSVDMHMNYMDYTNDACMYMFTEGQATRSENYVSSSLNILTSNASNVISGSGSGGGSGGGNNDPCGMVTDLTGSVQDASSIEISFTGGCTPLQSEIQTCG